MNERMLQAVADYFKECGVARTGTPVEVEGDPYENRVWLGLDVGGKYPNYVSLPMSILPDLLEYVYTEGKLSGDAL